WTSEHGSGLRGPDGRLAAYCQPRLDQTQAGRSDWLASTDLIESKRPRFRLSTLSTLTICHKQIYNYPPQALANETTSHRIAARLVPVCVLSEPNPRQLRTDSCL